MLSPCQLQFQVVAGGVCTQLAQVLQTARVSTSVGNRTAGNRKSERYTKKRREEAVSMVFTADEIAGHVRNLSVTYLPPALPYESEPLLNARSQLAQAAALGHAQVVRKGSNSSSPSFFQNKNGFPESFLSQQSWRILPSCQLGGKSHCHGYTLRNLQSQQVRHFITKRQQQATKEAQEGSHVQKPLNILPKFVNISVTQIFLFAIGAFIIYIVFRPLYQGITGGETINMVMNVQTKFEDVQGATEAKNELKSMVDFLRNPSNYTHIGARLPKGVLLTGPPGVGKTLLARAVAGEAGVPFFHASGSEFDEMFVGSGALKTKRLFAKARTHAPCVLFIDELDSVGSKRTSSPYAPYANQTINMLLSEMDGFKDSSGILVIAATNKPEQLDRALTRPGRFDVSIPVELPDLNDRVALFKFYTSKVMCKPDLDIMRFAKRTVGFSGADIESMVNQGAIRAAQRHSSYVEESDLEFAQDKLAMGPAKVSKVMSKEVLKCTAYHEAGHTLVAYFNKKASPLHKVTILPRGRTLGHTAFSYTEDELVSVQREQLLARMDVSMGGRAAEELIYGFDKITSGASADFKHATAIATEMIKNFGMSDKIGVRFVDKTLKVSGEAAQDQIDAEINRLLEESYERAKVLLKSKRAELEVLAKALLEHETLDSAMIEDILTSKQSGAKR